MPEPGRHASTVIAVDGPSGSGKSSVSRGVARAPRPALPRHRGDVPGDDRVDARPRRGRRRRRGGRRVARRSPSSCPATIPRPPRSRWTGSTCPPPFAEPRVTAAVSAVSAVPAGAAAPRRPPARGDRRRRHRRRGPRHRHRGVPGGHAQGLPDRERRGARRPPEPGAHRRRARRRPPDHDAGRPGAP